MILATHGILQGNQSPYDQVLNYATRKGYSLPSAPQQVLQRALLQSLIDNGIWDKLDTFAVFATNGDRNFALIDWKRLIDYTAFNTPTFTTNQGYQGDGINHWISTNFNPAIGTNNYKLDNASRFMWNKIISITGRGLDGTVTSGQNGMSSALTGGALTNHRINTGGTFTGTGIIMNIVGLIAINRNSSSTEIELFTNTTQYTRSQNSSAILSTPQLLWRNGNTSTLGTAQTAIYGMGASLVSENNTLRTILDTYLTNILL
jgi:hypothetical protein